MKSRITERTVGIMPVAYAGVDFSRNALYEFADQYKLRVIEDDAHAFGSFTKSGMRFGAEGDIICFSFDGIKNITCGEGGAVVTSDKAFARELRIRRALGIEQDVDLRYHGKRAWNYDVSVQGFRYHMSNLNAAIGLAQIKKIEKFREIKRNLFEDYINLSKKFKLDEKIKFNQNLLKNEILHICTAILPDYINRDHFRAHLLSLGIETGIHYVPNHLHTMYKTSYGLTNAERLGKTMISLPFHCNLLTSEIEFVLKSIKEYFDAI